MVLTPDAFVALVRAEAAKYQYVEPRSSGHQVGGCTELHGSGYGLLSGGGTGHHGAVLHITLPIIAPARKQYEIDLVRAGVEYRFAEDAPTRLRIDPAETLQAALNQGPIGVLILSCHSTSVTPEGVFTFDLGRETLLKFDLRKKIPTLETLQIGNPLRSVVERVFSPLYSDWRP